MSQVPVYYGHEELVQGNYDKYPGGYLHALVMSRVPASPITEMILSPAEAVLVERQLAEIFE